MRTRVTSLAYGVTTLVLWMIMLAPPVVAQTPAAKPSVPPQRATSSAMTNDDVTQLVKAGFAEDVIVARIQQASEKAFDLSVKGMLDLKALGVSDRLITVMVGGADPGVKKELPAAAVGVPTAPGAVPNTPNAPGIYVLEKGALTALEPSVATSAGTSAGNLALSGLTMGIKKIKVKARVRGSNANLRVDDNAEFYFYGSDFNPGQFVLAGLEVSDNQREIVAGQAGLTGTRSGIRDEDQVRVEVSRLDAGVYRVRSARPLTPGEYAFIDLSDEKNNKLWDFGVDR